MNANKAQPESLSHCQQQVTRLEAEVERLRQENEQLQRSDCSLHIPADLEPTHSHWLSTIATVANLLLRSPDYTTVLPDVVRLLGEAVGSDRCSTGQNITHPVLDRPAVRMAPEWEWCKAEVRHSKEFSPHSDQLFLWCDAPFLRKQLFKGEVINCLVADLPEPDRSLLSAQGNTAELFVPIMLNHQLWGFLAFDNCAEPRLYDEAEVAILKIAADSIAAAIERQAKDDELLRLERERSQELERLNTELQQTLDRLKARDRILEAIASAANVLLTTDDLEEAVNTAIQIIGEGLDTDRLNIHENFASPSNEEFLSYRTLYEWDSPQTIPQLSHPVAGEGSYAEIEWLYELFQKGQSASYQIEDAPEPFRSEQIEIGVKSTHLVPIYVGGNWWGVLGLDDCREAKRRSPAELAVLKTAAACIGSAIQRDRTQKAILQAEQERSQELQRLNTELQQTLDRLSEAEQRYRTLFELSSEGIVRFGYKQPIPLTLSVDEQLDLCYRSIYIAEWRCCINSLR